jgi:hypothetical protein
VIDLISRNGVRIDWDGRSLFVVTVDGTSQQHFFRSTGETP